MRTRTASRTLIGTATLVLITLGYGIFEARALMRGPTVIVVSPEAGETYRDQLITVKGTARDVVRLTLNGRPITLDLAGKFSEHVVTPRGYAVLTIEAESRFGRRTTHNIDIVGEPPGAGARTAHSDITHYIP